MVRPRAGALKTFPATTSDGIRAHQNQILRPLHELDPDKKLEDQQQPSDELLHSGDEEHETNRIDHVEQDAKPNAEEDELAVPL